jgi:hypothetical protein
MPFMLHLVCQHRLAEDVTDGEDVRQVGAHLDVNVDEASVCDSHNALA